MKKIYISLFFSFLAFLSLSQSLTFTPKGLGGGGALYAPSINPTNDNEFYMGCDMSELFHTTDYGNTFSQEHFQSIQGGHNSTMRFTMLANVRYCIDYSNDPPLPVKSTTNGTSWTALPGNPDPSEETYSINVDYNQPDHIIISYYNQIYFSANGGNNFTLIHTAVNSGSGVVVGGVFFDGNNIFIGTNDGLIISTNNGSSFSVANISGIPAGQAIFSFAGAKSGNTVRFFCVTADPNDIYVGIQGSDYWGFVKGIYSLDYGSGNWVSKINNININSDFVMYVALAENNITTAYLAGSNSNGEPEIMKTTNSGTSWSHIFNTTNNANIYTGWSGYGGDRGWGYGECAFGFTVAPQNANKLLFTDYGFVHVSSNAGTTWKQGYLNVADQNPIGTTTPVFKNYRSNGLENTTCWNMLWSDANHIFTAFSDINGVRSNNAGVSWQMAGATTLNSTYNFLKHTNGNIYAAASSVHDIYQTTRLTDATLDIGNGDIVFTSNNGTSWTTLHSFNHPVIWLATDPNNANRMYASVIHYANGVGEGGIWVTNNLQNGSASTWTKLANPPRTQGHPLTMKVLNDGTLICSYSGRRNSSGTFTNSSGVFKMASGSSTWTDISDNGMLYYTKDLVIDPNDANQNTWYACVWSGWGGPPNGLGGLYKTINRGQSWTKIFSGADRVSSITFSPTNQNEIWMTTETDGLWHSTNINAATPTFTQITSYPFRQPERVFYNPYNTNELWITSFGNGMKMANLSTTGFEKNSFNENGELMIVPNPVFDKFRVQGSGLKVEKIELFNLIGEKQAEKNFANKNSVEMDVRDLKRGIYLLKLFSGDKVVTRKIILK
jgi:hypothetical protein